MQLTRVAMLLAIIGTPVIIGFLQAPSARASQEAAISSIPITTDDNLDPITLVFTGYAPSWWVASNIADWSDSAYCSGPKPSTGTLTITHWSILTQPESLALVREITSESGTWDTVQSMDSGASARRIMSILYATRCVTTLSTAGREPKPTSGLPSHVDKRQCRYPTLL